MSASFKISLADLVVEAKMEEKRYFRVIKNNAKYSTEHILKSNFILFCAKVNNLVGIQKKKKPQHKCIQSSVEELWLGRYLVNERR